MSCRKAHTGSLTAFSILFVGLCAVVRCGPHAATATPTGIVMSMLYGQAIVYGQTVWPANMLWNKVQLDCAPSSLLGLARKRNLIMSAASSACCSTGCKSMQMSNKLLLYDCNLMQACEHSSVLSMISKQCIPGWCSQGYLQCAYLRFIF